MNLDWVGGRGAARKNRSQSLDRKGESGVKIRDLCRGRKNSNLTQKRKQNREDDWPNALLWNMGSKEARKSGKSDAVKNNTGGKGNPDKKKCLSRDEGGNLVGGVIVREGRIGRKGKGSQRRGLRWQKNSRLEPERQSLKG